MGPNGMRTLLTGRGLVESPRWHGDRLYFSDWSAGEVVPVDLAGRSEVIARVESLPLCTAWLPDGRLVIVSSPDRRPLRPAPDGSLGTHANPGQRCVRVGAGGAVLQTVELDRGAFACALGGPGGTTLFIVAAEWRGMTGQQMVAPGSGQVLTTEVAVPGAGWP